VKRTALHSCAAAVWLLALLGAQDPPRPSWPALDESRAARARVLCEELIGTDEEAAVAATDELVAMGAGVAPLVIARLGEAKASRHADAFAGILDQVVADQHAPLVEDCAKQKQNEIRAWAVGWLARHPDEQHRDVLEKTADDKDAEVAFRAAAGLLALGDLDRLEAVFETCAEDWPPHAAFVGAVLPPARSAEAAELVFAKMTAKEVRAQVTGLRLLRSLAPPDTAGRIGSYLDAQQHAVKKEAINALRVVVDGEAPIEDLSVFQAIEQAKQWKERLR
jgi:hypothetical protein